MPTNLVRFAEIESSSTHGGAEHWIRLRATIVLDADAKLSAYTTRKALTSDWVPDVRNVGSKVSFSTGNWFKRDRLVATLTNAQGIRIGKIWRTCIAYDGMIALSHMIPLDRLDRSLEEFGECECDQLYRIATGSIF